MQLDLVEHFGTVGNERKNEWHLPMGSHSHNEDCQLHVSCDKDHPGVCYTQFSNGHGELMATSHQNRIICLLDCSFYTDIV